MSDLLQRLIARTRAPLSAIQPILPSIYAPAERGDHDGGITSPSDVAEPVASLSESSSGQIDVQGIREEPPPMEREPTETQPLRAPAAHPPSERGAQRPAPPPSETEARSPLTATSPSPPLLAPPPKPKDPIPPAPQSKSTDFMPALGAKPLPPKAESALPAPESNVMPGESRKSGGKTTGPITRTVVPPGLGSKIAYSRLHRAAAAMRNASPPPEQTVSSTAGETNASSADHEAAGIKRLPARETPAATSSRRKVTEAIDTPSNNLPPRDPRVALRRNREDAETMGRSQWEASPARPSEGHSKKSPPLDGQAPSVEVRVSIGHIEVKAAQPAAPAPRRTPQRPRVTLDEFLKSPHYGGPR